MIKFDEKYNQEIFSVFLREFLPEDYTEKEKDITQIDYCKIIKNVRERGYSESLDLTVLEMSHEKETDPRVSVATEAFRILANYGMSRALVIFKNDNSNNYRFSYLTISLDIEKNKVTKKYSNARRYSFYLGVGSKTKTPEQQLIKKGKVTDRDDLLSRFSLEVVNKQFYLEVAKFFDELVSDINNLKLPSVSESDINPRKSFAVRLIGRIMFCWFLKQKKSDKGQLIPDELLSSKAVKDNYYHALLEPLFFGVLNTSMESRDIRSDLFDKVPYLNGGLFNPQTEDYYELDHQTFTSKYTYILNINDSWFKKFFELLETYNFTIDENTVFDQELSVDPEMLGRIFENLLAEINPETGSSERKRTGSFYTPRQIVEYMVDQSLVEYFKTKTAINEQKLNSLVSYDLADDGEFPLEQNDKKLIINAIESLKILDPACGSGAFPIGILQKIVYILHQIDPDCTMWLEKKLQNVPDLYKQKIIHEVRENPFDYTRKLDVIKNSIFGVDIQPIAVDVSRLRCFLTLVVESEINDNKPNRGIEPLPNLDFKFVCANTLFNLPKQNNIGLFEDHSGIIELSKIMSEYFSCNNQRKNDIKIKFTSAQKGILEKMLSLFGRNTGELTLKLTTWDPFSNHPNSWFDPEWMFGLDTKFDIVIGNPPYKVVLTREESFKYYKNNYTLSKGGKINLYKLFFEKGLELLNEGGVLSYISPNNYLTSNDSINLRTHLIKYTKIVSIVDYPEKDKVFQNVTQAVAVIVLIKNKIESYSFKFNQYGQINSILSSDIKRKTTYIFKPLVNLISKIEDNTKIIDNVAYGYQGEINVSTKKDFFTKEARNEYLPLIRGNNIEKYRLKVAINEFCPINIQSRDHYKIQRIIFQDVSNSGLKERVNGLILPYPVLCGHTTNYLFSKDKKYSNYFLLGLLNSKVVNYYFKHYNQTNHVPIGEIKNVPVPEYNESLMKEVEELVSKIINSSEHQAELKSKIDNIIMELYKLKEEERAIIDHC